MKIIIEPGRAARNYWVDIWRYRELMYFLAWRDIAVRYKQTAIGVAWALIRPALTMLVFVGFRRMAGLPTSGSPEPILVYAAVLPWQFFSTGLSESSASLIANANLISKVYFPRLIVPIAAAAASLADFLITLSLLAALMLWYGFAPGWQILMLPVFIILAFGLSIGPGLFFAALNVEYRDFRYVVPFIVQLGLFVSPVAFSTSDVPERWRLLYDVNPMAGVIDGFRWSILGDRGSPDWNLIAVSVIITMASLYLGSWYFRRMERGFADVI